MKDLFVLSLMEGLSVDFNYEELEVNSLLIERGPHKIKLVDDAGNSTKWLTLDYDTFKTIREVLIKQGGKRD